MEDSKIKKDPVAVIDQAIEYFLDNASWKPDLVEGEKPEDRERGYVWKNVYLPNGTKIEMRHKGQVFPAEVLNGVFKYQGKKTTPAQMVNKVSKTSLNAWLYIWIKRPDDVRWLSAGSLRKTPQI